MELRVLRYFLAIVNERNISKAAQHLHVSQPTISRQIKDLEEELGVVLFERGSRRIELTPAGDYFVTQAQQILALTDKTLTNIQQTQEIHGSIAIGGAEAPMMHTIAKAVFALSSSAPKVTANFYSADATEVCQKVQSGLFDFGVVMEPVDKTNFNFITLPGTTHFGILTRRDNALAQKSLITVEDLQQQRLILPQQLGSSDILGNWLGANVQTYEIAATYNLLYNASILASEGVGSVLCLDGIVNPIHSELTFIPLTPSLETQATLIWPQLGRLSSADNAFLTEVKNLLSLS